MYTLKVTAHEDGHTLQLYRKTARGQVVPVPESKVKLAPGVKPTVADVESVLSARSERLLGDIT